MKKLTVIFYLAILSACGNGEGLCRRPVVTDDSRPDILIIGDSISYGWMPTVKEALEDRYDIIHNPCNGKDSGNGSAHINYWLSLRPHWEVIIFNHGVWDSSPSRGITSYTYNKYLSFEAWRIVNSTGKSLFVLTTSLPTQAGQRYLGVEEDYNHIAVNIMNMIHVPVVDNYSLSLSIPELRRNADLQNDVHWTEAGSQKFGQNVLDALDLYYGIH